MLFIIIVNKMFFIIDLVFKYVVIYIYRIVKLFFIKFF